MLLNHLQPQFTGNPETEEMEDFSLH